MFSSPSSHVHLFSVTYYISSLHRSHSFHLFISFCLRPSRWRSFCSIPLKSNKDHTSSFVHTQKLTLSLALPWLLNLIYHQSCNRSSTSIEVILLTCRGMIKIDKIRTICWNKVGKGTQAKTNISDNKWSDYVNVSPTHCPHCVHLCEWVILTDRNKWAPSLICFLKISLMNRAMLLLPRFFIIYFQSREWYLLKAV